MVIICFKNLIAISWIAVKILRVPKKFIKYFSNWGNILLNGKLVFIVILHPKVNFNLNTVSKDLQIGCKEI